MPKVERGEVQPPSLAAVRRLVEHAPERLQALVVLAAGSGLRSSTFARSQSVSDPNISQLLQQRGYAEHEYATLVSEHPGWDTEPCVSQSTADYGEYASVADVFRQFGPDERVHKQESEAQLGQPRFH